MRLMRYTPTDWLDVVAMRVEGMASSWVNAILQDVASKTQASCSALGPSSRRQWCSNLSQSLK